MSPRFKNRREAGRILADKFQSLLCQNDLVVLGLPRGGVPVAYEVALKLKATLGIFLVRKLGVPGHEEYAMGAIASGGLWFVQEEVVRQQGISRAQIKKIVEREQREMERRAEAYGTEFSQTDVRGQTVIVVDDGLATGSTMHAAVTALKQKHPERLIVAVPVASPSTCQQLEKEVSEVVCVQQPENFSAVSQWYENFSQTTDEEVCELLKRAREQFEPVMASPLWPAGF